MTESTPAYREVKGENHEHTGVESHQYGTCVRCGHVILATWVNQKTCDKSFQNKFWIILLQPFTALGTATISCMALSEAGRVKETPSNMLIEKEKENLLLDCWE